MKAGWEVKRLGEVCEKVSTGPFGSILHKKDYVDTGIPLVNPIDMVEGEIQHNSIKRVSRETADRLTSYQMKSGDIAVARRGDLGRCVLLRDEHNGWLCGTGSFFVTPSAALISDYLVEYIRSPAAIDCFERASTGATMPNISNKTLSGLPVPIPPLEEQKRIVAVLDAAFERLTRAKENAEANLQNARELFESTLSYLFGQSEDWQETALNDHVSFMDYRGKTPPKREAGVRLITAKNVKRGFVQVEPKEFIDAEAYDGWMTRGFPEEGDVLFTTEAPLANVAQLDTLEKVVIGQRLITMKPDRDLIDREFLKFALMSPQMREEIFSYATGATVLGIKAKLLKTVRFRFPNNLDDQCKVAAQCRTSFEKMDELAEVYRTKLTDIADLRQSLLQKAFAGELT